MAASPDKLDQAEKRAHEVLSILPSGHPAQFTCYYILGHSELNRYQFLVNKVHLDASIEWLQMSVCKAAHFGGNMVSLRSRYFILGVAYRYRFIGPRNLTDIQESINCLTLSFDEALCQDDPVHQVRLVKIVTSLCLKLQTTADINDEKMALEWTERALSNIRENHELRPVVLAYRWIIYKNQYS